MNELPIGTNDNTAGNPASSAVETIVMCKVGDVEMPVQIIIDGKPMRFILFPESDGTWNAGYICKDNYNEFFINSESMYIYLTPESAAKACKNALISNGYWEST